MQPIYTVAAVIANDSGEVLLVRKRSSSIFIQPGGKIEPGEEPLPALVRELDEELGVRLDVSSTTRLGEFEAAAVNEPGRTVRAQAYTCSIQGSPAAQAEIEELVWIRPSGPYHVPVAPLSATHILPAYAASVGSNDASGGQQFIQADPASRRGSILASGGEDVGSGMHQDEIKRIFDEQAASYDTQWAKTAAIRSCLYFLLDSLFAELPADARILCVGVGTGAELAHLAEKNPAWRFTAVEPSGPMLDVCRQRAEKERFASRCHFHEGYLDSLPAGELHDAATCFLVSQFILDQQARSGFFREISRTLKPGGILASSDLASDVESPEYEVLLRAWVNMMAASDVSPGGVDRMRKAYANDVGVLPPDRISTIIESGGFEPPAQFFQAGLIHAWLSRRAPSNDA